MSAGKARLLFRCKDGSKWEGDSVRALVWDVNGVAEYILEHKVLNKM